MTVRVGEEAIVDQEMREEKTPANNLPRKPWFRGLGWGGGGG